MKWHELVQQNWNWGTLLILVKCRQLVLIFVSFSRENFITCSSTVLIYLNKADYWKFMRGNSCSWIKKKKKSLQTCLSGVTELTNVHWLQQGQKQCESKMHGRNIIRKCGIDPTEVKHVRPNGEVYNANTMTWASSLKVCLARAQVRTTGESVSQSVCFISLTRRQLKVLK